MPATTAALEPVQVSQRIEAMDIARGFALLGILSVNISAFAQPMGRLIETTVPSGQGTLGTLLHYVVQLFFMGKSYPLFCMLFGMGLTIQQVRAKRAGRSADWLQVRRLLVLAVFGLCHIFLLWYGDILLTYATIGLAVFWALKFPARGLLKAAVLFILFGSILCGGFQSLTTPDPKAEGMHTAASWVVPPVGMALEGGHPVTHLTAALERTDPPFDGPQDKAWMDAETIASRDGPYLDAMVMRLVNYAGYLMFLAFGGWQMVGLVLMGSVLVQTRFLDADRRAWQVRAVIAAALIGVPAASADFWLGSHPSTLMRVLTAASDMFFSPLISLGYLGAAGLVANSGILRHAMRLLASAGRMALTNYLMQSLICSMIFQHWGFGQFASWTIPQMAALVAGIYLVQLPLSAAWLSVFRFGPMEWLWRSLSYMRLQPMLGHAAGRYAPS
ncbi:MAG: DUF418 domain-containing protein [Planctomycetes bacterium]|nr:DUF418 domain-containing protein [Planctomycetota bacterium]